MSLPGGAGAGRACSIGAKIIMRRLMAPTIVLVTFASSSFNAACAQAALSCQLSANECAIITAILQREFALEDYDMAIYSHMSPMSRDLRVNERKFARLKNVSAKLPIRIGDELSRMILCDAEERSMALHPEQAHSAGCT